MAGWVKADTPVDGRKSPIGHYDEYTEVVSRICFCVSEPGQFWVLGRDYFNVGIDLFLDHIFDRHERAGK